MSAAISPALCPVCGISGCVEARGVYFHAGPAAGIYRVDYTGTPPFADAEWKDDPEMCQWCGGTGHPHGDESFGFCECPALQQEVAR
jgi:hypothetical protein